MGIKGLPPRRQRRGKSGRIVGTKQGYFPVNESEKYFGDPECVYRSSWEYVFMLRCERNDKVAKWASELFPIKYIAPDGKERNYYPDFYIEYTNGKKELIEVKPFKETKPSSGAIYHKNKAKWLAAIKWCEENDYSFKIVTERSPILKGKIK